MNVGLFGDSFGTGSLLHTGEYGIGFKYHWSKILENQYKWHITNYAISGSSIYETYNLFLNNQAKYEKNIVIVTITGRYYDKIKLSNYPDMHIVSIPHLESVVEHKILTEEDKLKLNYLRGWYELSLHHYEKQMSDLMIKHMKEIRPDTIFIRVTDERKDIDNYPLINIYYDQCKQLGFDGSKISVSENQDLISGHFTPEVNEKFAKYLVERIETGNWPHFEITKDIRFQYKANEYFTF